MTVSFIHQHFIFQTIANKKSGTLSEGVLINALKFISDKIVNFTVNNTGLNKLANKDEVVEAAESLKAKIDEVFRQLDTAEAASSGDEDDDDLKSLLEGRPGPRRTSQRLRRLRSGARPRRRGLDHPRHSRKWPASVQALPLNR